MMSRRSFMVGGGAAGVALGAGLPPSSAGTPLVEGERWLTALGTSLKAERDYRPRVEGRIPAGLRGRLFRNGPGLFERNGYRKQHLLDGDGMIQCFDFTDDGVRYRNRFVRTEKYLAEEAAGELLYPTWTTRAPGGVLANIGGGIQTQAGVTTLVRNGRLLALDEGIPLYELDPDTLATTGQFAMPAADTMTGCKAHTKIMGADGDWVLAATNYGRTMTLRYQVLDVAGKVKAKGNHESPRMTYVHDFFATDRYVVFLLHPVDFSPFAMLAGLRSFTDSLTWAPDQGGIIMVVDKDGGTPRVFEAPASFMWHSVNAYEKGREIIADFIGYDDPDHFIGEDPVFKTVMKGERGNAKHPGRLRRFRINLQMPSLVEEIIDAGHHEFPVIDPRRVGAGYRYAYMNRGNVGSWTLDGVARYDAETGARDEFRFGPRHFVSEPIFAPRGEQEGDGWLLAQVQSGETGNNFLAVFDTASLSAGPVARIHLAHHVPLSFHGYWDARG